MRLCEKTVTKTTSVVHPGAPAAERTTTSFLCGKPLPCYAHDMVHDWAQVLAALCAARKQWGLYVNIGFDDGEEWLQTIKTMVPQELDPLIHAGGGIVFGDRAMIDSLYDRIHGDDGPCPPGPNGRCPVAQFHCYALTCDDSGQHQNENT